MSVISNDSISFAVANIAKYGDTDVFPFPIENHWFHDAHAQVVKLLTSIDEDFDNSVGRYPIVSVKSLSSVGYSGFRAATQIDPIWNAYLLALVIELGHDIENARIPSNREVIFSYRYAPDLSQHTLFSTDIGWAAFQNIALKKADSSSYILSTDISDFYPRIYHHRLENALHQACQNKTAIDRIKTILFRLSGETSYGLPVGGNAARILAELLLNRVDRLLLSYRIEFVRFVDDYYIFAESRQQAQEALVLLSEFLLPEGLSLSRAKTRFMTSAEFQRSSPMAKPEVAESRDESETRNFLKLRLRFDPYSPTAEEDYTQLSAELDKFDIVGMLAREFGKSRVDETLVRQLVKGIRFLKRGIREQAIQSLLQNLGLLYPVFPTVVILLRSIIGDIETETRESIFEAIRGLFRNESHIIMVPANLAFAVRLVAYDRHDVTDSLLIEIYNRSRIDMMIKRDILLAMAYRRGSYWLSPAIRQFAVVTPWEKERFWPLRTYLETKAGIGEIVFAHSYRK